MSKQRDAVLRSALELAGATESEKLFLFLNTDADYRWAVRAKVLGPDKPVVPVFPRELGLDRKELREAGIVHILGWSGNQSRFSRIKYAFLNGVLQGIIKPRSKVVCVLGPWGKKRLDTITVHDLSRSWGREFPFDPRSLFRKRSFNIVMAVTDIALDIGATGREGKPVGTTFVVGDDREVMRSSHQAVFNPFRGYAHRDRLVTLPEVVESIKELAQLDGAFVISSNGVVQAAGRHLDAASVVTKELRGLGSRHRAAAGITRRTGAVAVVVSESTGRITIFDDGRIVTTLEPVIGTRLV